MVGITQQGDAVGAVGLGACPALDDALDPAADALAVLRPFRSIALGHQHVAIRQDDQLAWMVEPLGEGDDAEPVAWLRRGTLGPAAGRGDVDGRDQALAW